MHHQIHQFHDFRTSLIVSPDVWSLPTSWRAVWLILRWQVAHKVHHHHEVSSTAQKPCGWSLTLQYFSGSIYTNQLNKFKDRKHDASEYIGWTKSCTSWQGSPLTHPCLDCFDCMLHVRLICFNRLPAFAEPCSCISQIFCQASHLTASLPLSHPVAHVLQVHVKIVVLLMEWLVSLPSVEFWW